MNKKISAAVASLLVYGSSVTLSQRPIPYVQEKKDYVADDVVGTWKWFCGSIVTVTDNGEVRAVWDDGKRADGRFDKIGDNKYRFIWGNNESVDILKIKKEGNLLEGQNQAGSKVTALKISSTPGIEGNQERSSEHFLPNAKKTMQTTQDYKKYIGEWKMSSWNGHYQLFDDGSCIIDNDLSNPSKGLWFFAFDRLYLVWGMMSDTDVFKLNPDQSMKLQRIDNRSAANVTFEKLQAINSSSNKETEHKPIIRRRIRVPQNPGEPVKVVENYQGHKYEFIPDKKPWKLASEIARQKGGYLVSLTSEDENSFVTKLIQNASKECKEINQRVWIGLNKDNQKSEWLWESGEKYEFSSWGKGEPNNEGNRESSVLLNHESYNPDKIGKWNDGNSEENLYYIIEYNKV